MAAVRSASFSAISSSATSLPSRRATGRQRTPTILCIGWDPEGVLGPPKSGHIARLELRRKLERDSDAREAFQRQVREETERRRAARQARAVPETDAELVEYFLDTEAREIEIEIARLRPRLNKAFFDYLQLEIAKLRFSVNKTKEIEDRLIELEAMQQVLIEGAEAYDKLQEDLVSAKERLMKILQSKDRKSTFAPVVVTSQPGILTQQLLEMVERNELNRSILALLDENIAGAVNSGQKETAAFMEDVRSSIVKYITV